MYICELRLVDDIIFNISWGTHKLSLRQVYELIIYVPETPPPPSSMSSRYAIERSTSVELIRISCLSRLVWHQRLHSWVNTNTSSLKWSIFKFDILLTVHRDKLYNRTNEMHFFFYFWQYLPHVSNRQAIHHQEAMLYAAFVMYHEFI